MKKIVFALLALIAIFSFPGRVWAVTADLRVEGNKFMMLDGTRFIVKGVNVEAYRDYIGGCGYVTDNLFSNDNLNKMATKLRALGINAVRLNYDWRYINTSGYSNLKNYLDIFQALANQGMYVMPSDHSQTGQNLAYRSSAYPTFKAIIDGVRARGLEKYLIMNPFNEPGDMAWVDWVTANKDILNYLRTTAGFKGIVALDTITWSSSNDNTNRQADFQAIMTYDAQLLGGKSNVSFENHWYPNMPVYGSGYVDTSMDVAKTYPIAIGELGQENPGASPLVPQYPIDVLNLVVGTGIPNGHNGVFGWIWSWCDINTMTAAWDDYVNLNSYGQVYNNYYWTKVASVNPPPPAPLPSGCGNGTCDSGETCTSCSADCGSCPPPPPPNTCTSTSTVGLRGVTSGSNGSGASSLTLVKPAGVTSGDVMVAQITVRGASTGITAPAGWTSVRSDSTSLSIKQELYSKVAGSAEPASYQWSFNPGPQMASGGISAYSGADDSLPVDASSGYYNYESSVALAPGVTTTLPNDMLLFFDGVTAQTSVNPPSGMVERWDLGSGDATTGTTSEMADKVVPTAGPTGDQVGSHNGGTKSNLAQLVALKPKCLSSTSIPGDLNGDGHVNSLDLRQAIANFALASYNLVVANFGK